MSEAVSKVTALIEQCETGVVFHEREGARHKQAEDQWNEWWRTLQAIRRRLIELEKELPCT